MRTVTYFVYDYKDMQKVIKRYFHREYDIIAEEEAHNGTNITIEDLKWQKKPNKDDEEEIKLWKRGVSGEDAPFITLEMLIQYMINNMALPNGNYLVEVNW